MLVLKLAPVWLCFLLCFLLACIAGERNRIARDGRLYWIVSTMATGALMVFITELAGALHSLDRAAVTALWVLADVAITGLIAGKFRADLRNVNLGKSLVEALGGSRGQPLVARLIFGVGLAFAVLLGGVSLRAPTLVPDDQAYHVPRIMHWLQNKSLRPYACNNVAQVGHAPGAEIASATLDLLDGSDGPINLPSWFSVITSALLASFVTELLLNLFSERTGRQWPREKVRLAAAFSFLLVLTVPEGISEAISTENDFVVAMWNLSLACMTVLYLREPANLFYAVGVGLSLALGICTKATTFISGAPFVAGAFGLLAWRRFYREAAQLAGILVLAVLLVNGPWFLRNYRVFGHPLGSANISAVAVNGAMSPSRALANIFRNLSLYTRTPSAAVTQALNDVVYALIFWTGCPPEDPPNIYPYYHFDFQTAADIGKGQVWGDPHAWLILAAFLVILVIFPLRNALGFHGAATCLGFCLFCIYLRWQPWHSRLHIMYFVLAMPVVAIGLVAVAHRAVIIVLALVCLANAMFLVLYNPLYPLNSQARLQEKPREEQMMQRLPFLYAPYVALAEDIVQRGCTNVLLKCGGAAFEYSLWVFLRDRGFKGTIEHWLVNNETAKLSRTVVSAQTALVFVQSTPPVVTNVFYSGQPHPLLSITYYDTVYDFGGTVTIPGTIMALFPASTLAKWDRMMPPGNEVTRSVNLQGIEGIGTGRPARVLLSCKAVDRHGLAVTNHAVKVEIGGSTSEIDLQAGWVAASALVTQPNVPVSLSLLGPVPEGRGPIYVSDLRLVWEWAAKASPP